MVVHDYRNSVEAKDKKMISQTLDDVPAVDKESQDPRAALRCSTLKLQEFSKNYQILVLVDPPFLLQTHIGYKVKSLGLRKAAIDDRFTVLCQKRHIRRQHREKVKINNEGRQKRLETCVSDLKRRNLLNIYNDPEETNSSVMIVIELFNIINVLGCTDDFTTVFIRIIGTNEDGTVVDYETEVYRHLTQLNNKKAASSVFEFILPKVGPNLTELYIFAEVKYRKFSEFPGQSRMRNRLRHRASVAFTDHRSDHSASIETLSSLSSSISDEITAVGALKIATKNRQSNSEEGPWLVSYRNLGLTLLSGSKNETSKFSSENAKCNVVNLAEKCRRVARQGPTPTLRLELSNEESYGSFSKDELATGQIKRRLRSRIQKNRKTARAKPEEGDVTYNLDALAKSNMLLLVQRGLRLPVAYKMKNESHWLLNLKSVQNKVYYAHKDGKRGYRCLFCIKQFNSMQTLQFHLEYSYPLFLFSFEPAQVVVVVDESKLAAEPFRKKSNEDDFSFFKYRPLPRESSYPDSGVSSTGSDNAKTHGPKSLLPYERSFLSVEMYSKCSTLEGMYGHEINTDFMEEIFRHRFSEFVDVDKTEIAFYIMWNMFTNVERCNRTKDIRRIYEKLKKFVRLYRQVVAEQNLDGPFMSFLTLIRVFRYINEEEFMNLMTYGTHLENNYQGYDDVVAKKQELEQARLQHKQRRGRKKKVP